MLPECLKIFCSMSEIIISYLWEVRHNTNHGTSLVYTFQYLVSPLYAALKTRTEEILQELHQNQLDTSDTDGWSSSSDEVPEKRQRLRLSTQRPKKSPTPVMYDTYSVTT